MVWALAKNTIACRYCRAMGGAERGRAQDRFCGVPLAKIGFAWSFAAPWILLRPRRPARNLLQAIGCGSTVLLSAD